MTRERGRAHRRATAFALAGLLALACGCSSPGPPRDQVDRDLQAWATAHRDPPAKTAAPAGGGPLRVRWCNVQRIELAPSRRAARVHVALDAVAYDFQTTPPGELDASGTYYFDFTRTEQGAWRLSGGPIHE